MNNTCVSRSSIEVLQTPTDLKLLFDRENLKELSPYFDVSWVDCNTDSKIQFFQNLKTLSRFSLGLAHCIQHNMIARTSVEISQCQEAKQLISSKPFDEIIGCYSSAKPSDSLHITDHMLDGKKNWISMLDQADFAIMQLPYNGSDHTIYFDLKKSPCQIIQINSSLIGMELARPDTLVIDRHMIDPAHILGQHGTAPLFQKSNVASYSFITNYCGLAQQLYIDFKNHVKHAELGTEFDLKKIEIDISSMIMQWEDNLYSVGLCEVSDKFWHKRNTQYAFGKKCLISVLQLILETGMSAYYDSHSEFSQRFRDALVYASHMHTLSRFAKDNYLYQD